VRSRPSNRRYGERDVRQHGRSRLPVGSRLRSLCLSPWRAWRIGGSSLTPCVGNERGPTARAPAPR
jgi:hypothetical protein